MHECPLRAECDRRLQRLTEAGVESKLAEFVLQTSEEAECSGPIIEPGGRREVVLPSGKVVDVVYFNDLCGHAGRRARFMTEQEL
jgi:hypothetical protein